MGNYPAEFTQIPWINPTPLSQAIMITYMLPFNLNFVARLLLFCPLISFCCPHACRLQVEAPDLILVWLHPYSLSPFLSSFLPSPSLLSFLFS